jgi:hypothetical protein
MQVPAGNMLGLKPFMSAPLVILLMLAVLMMAMIDRLLSGREAYPD